MINPVTVNGKIYESKAIHKLYDETRKDFYDNDIDYDDESNFYPADK